MPCTNCKRYGSLVDALESIIWYNGHYEWLAELRNDMLQHIKDPVYYLKRESAKEVDTEEHAIWMLLVGMFGNWGTSINYGWVEDIAECIQFIDAVCKESWEHEGIEVKEAAD